MLSDTETKYAKSSLCVSNAPGPELGVSWYGIHGLAPCSIGGTVYTQDLKFCAREGLWVRIPHGVPTKRSKMDVVQIIPGGKWHYLDNSWKEIKGNVSIHAGRLTSTAEWSPKWVISDKNLCQVCFPPENV